VILFVLDMIKFTLMHQIFYIIKFPKFPAATLFREILLIKSNKHVTRQDTRMSVSSINRIKVGQYLSLACTFTS